MADRPMRIQLSRRKGWRMPPNTVRCSRPGTFSNPWGVRECAEIFDLSTLAATAQVVAWFSEWIALEPGAEQLSDFGAFGPERPQHEKLRARLPTLAGKNLACWCRLCPRHAAGKPFDEDCPDCAPCHADVLGALANGLSCDSPPASEAPNG